MLEQRKQGSAGSYLTLDVDGAECRCSEIKEQRRRLTGVEPVRVGVQSAVLAIFAGGAVLDQKIDRFGVGIKS